MIKHGDIPEGAMELVDEITGNSHIEVIWGETDTVYVVGWTGTKRKSHYAYRFFKIGLMSGESSWQWSADYRQH